MIKRRKDSGFTLIELMIVIAVIGILAIVLVPRVGVVKAQAKEAGLDTNVRLVQGYVESRIDRWVSKGQTKAQVESAIVSAFTFNDPLKNAVNPVTSIASNASVGAPAAATGSIFVMNSGVIGGVPATAAGVIVVVVHPDFSAAIPIKEITIHAFGANGTLLPEKTVTIRP